MNCIKTYWRKCRIRKNKFKPYGWRPSLCDDRNQKRCGRRHNKAIGTLSITQPLGFFCSELDDSADVISYEEYHPYGTTAYQAKNAAIKAVAKRYRYTGMERDEETGLEYHSARYYLPWLGRWLSADPIGIGGINFYQYAKDTPVNFLIGQETIQVESHSLKVITTKLIGHYWMQMIYQ